MTIDVNVSLFRYPTRRLPYDDTRGLAEFLNARGVTQAWAGSFEGLLHHDLAGVNQRLAEECQRAVGVELIPFGTVNPLLSDWEEDLRRCQEVHRMPGIRLFPSFHGYGLDDPQFDRLLKLADERKMIVQLAVRIEDVRTSHRLLNMTDVDIQPLKQLAVTFPQLRIVLLNALMSCGAAQQTDLTQAGRVYFEIATLEGVGGISRLLKSVPAERVLFGSHAPFFVWESADLKLKESLLPEPLQELIRQTNARNLLEAHRR